MDFTQQIEAIREQGGISGVAVALVRDGALVYSAAFGQDGEQSLTVTTPFEVASLSKMVFAYTALKLVENGVLDLDRPLSDYLPTPYITGEPHLNQITARHTLSHSSGFPNWRDEHGLRTQFKPGTAFHYSTEGMIYLQTVIEHLIGQPFHEYVRGNLLEPFGMHDSAYIANDMTGMPDFLPRHLYSVGAINLQTTAPDYARFLVEVMCEQCEDAYHLGDAIRRELLKPQIPVGDQQGLSWGLGFGLQEIDGLPQSFWHWGGRKAMTRNFAMAIPETQSGIVILTHHFDGLNLCEPILRLVWEIVGEIPSLRWLLPAKQWRADGKIQA